MTTFAASQHGAKPGGIAGDAVIQPSGRRGKIEAFGPPRHPSRSRDHRRRVTPRRAMTGRSRSASRVAPYAPSLPEDARRVLWAVGSATLPRVAMIAVALLLILVILPAVVGAAGTQAVAAV